MSSLSRSDVTPAETLVLQRLLRGLSNRSIAAELAKVQEQLARLG